LALREGLFFAEQSAVEEGGSEGCVQLFMCQSAIVGIDLCICVFFFSKGAGA